MRTCWRSRTVARCKRLIYEREQPGVARIYGMGLLIYMIGSTMPSILIVQQVLCEDGKRKWNPHVATDCQYERGRSFKRICLLVSASLRVAHRHFWLLWYLYPLTAWDKSA